MSENTIPADRQKKILALLSQKGVVTVAELTRMFGVSELTIRRDLDALHRKGVLERTHGGAISNQRMSAEPPYSQKGSIHRAEKKSIGAAAAALVEEGDTLLVNSGSTTLEVIRHLRGKKVRVITSNAGAIPEAVGSEMEVILLGGLYRSQSNSMVGALARHSLQQVYGGKAFIGTDGINLKYGLTTPILDEAEIAREMIRRTPGPVIVVADHSKLRVVSNFVTAPLEEVDILITDEKIDTELKLGFEKMGIQVVIASSNRQREPHEMEANAEQP